MKQLGKIFKFEFKNYLQNRVFVGVTVFFVIAIALVMFAPRLISLVQNEDGETEEGRDELPVMLILSENAGEAELLAPSFSGAFEGYRVLAFDGDLASAKEKILSGEAECAFLLHSLTSYTYYVENLSMYDMNTVLANELLTGIYRMNAMVAGGLSPEEAQTILTAPIESSTENLGVDQMQNFFYTYIMIFALYMVILLYGQMIASNVATEKSSRAMELLITSAKPVNMMFGKVLASCLAGLLQLVAIFGSALLFFRMNDSYWGKNPTVAAFFDIPVSLFFYMLLFFVLGFLVYAFLYGAIGSTVSKLEDINTSVMPLTMLFLVGFFVVVFSMSSGDIDNIAMLICSYVPFTSPMAMFTRIAMSTVAWYEILISVLLLIISVFGVGVISAKIYRVGVLLYGTPPKIGAIIKAIRRS